MASFKQQCPSCEAMVTVKDLSFVGKKIECPKCKYRFVVEAPADAVDSDDDEAAVAEVESKKATSASASEGKAAKAGKSTATKSGSKAKPLPRRDEANDEEQRPNKKEKKKGKSNPTLTIGLGVGGVALLLLGIAFATGIFNGGGSSASSKSSSSSSSSSGTAGSTQTTIDPDMGGGSTEDPNKANAAANVVPEKDISNLLPNDTQAVFGVNMEKWVQTPFGRALFDLDAGQGSALYFQRSLGLLPTQVSKMLIAGNFTDKWMFAVFLTQQPTQEATLRTAMARGERPVSVKGKTKSWTYYPVKNNELILLLDKVASSEGKKLGIPFGAANPSREMGLTVIDDRTFVVADVAPLKQFLGDDAKPVYQSIYEADVSNNDPDAPNPGGYPPMGSGYPPGATGPMGPAGPGSVGPMGPANPGTVVGKTPPPGRGGPIIPMGPATPGATGPANLGGNNPANPSGDNNAPKANYSRNPTFLTVHPDLKAMLNELERDGEPIIVTAWRRPPYKSMLLAMLQASGQPVPPIVNLMPNNPDLTLGLIVNTANANRFVATLGFEYPDNRAATAVAQLLRPTVPTIAESLSELIASPVFPMGGAFDPNNPNAVPGGTGFSGGPGFPGGPGGPGFPMGPGGPGGPGFPMGPGGPGRGPLGPDDGDGFNPNPGFNPNAPGATQQNYSYVAIDQYDRLLKFKFDLDWKASYRTRIDPAVRSFIETHKGRAMILAGQTNWYNLASTIRQMTPNPQAELPLGAFDRGTDVKRFNLPYPPDQRVSFHVELLPYLGHRSVSDRIDRSQSWNYNPEDGDKNNLLAGMRLIPEFLAPNTPSDTWTVRVPSVNNRELGSTHFVGLAGIGMNAGYYPNDPAHAKKLGLFGFGTDRRIRYSDITDGTEQTIFMIQVPPTIPSPWIRGGGATVRGVPEKGSIKPFVSTVGAGGVKGTHALMADGSVRFISETISDDVFKALVTYKGGELITTLESVAPPVKIPQPNELRSAPAGTPMP